MAANKLTDEVRAFIVKGLACYDTPAQVAAAVKSEFGIEIARQTVECYNPTRVAGKVGQLSEKWRKLFERERKKFKEDVSDIPIASKAFRLRSLSRLHATAESRGNAAMASSLLEQAAKEMGEVFTNKQKIEGKVQSTARVVVVPAKGGPPGD